MLGDDLTHSCMSRTDKVKQAVSSQSVDFSFFSFFIFSAKVKYKKTYKTAS